MYHSRRAAQGAGECGISYPSTPDPCLAGCHVHFHVVRMPTSSFQLHYNSSFCHQLRRRQLCVMDPHVNLTTANTVRGLQKQCNTFLLSA